MSNFYNEFLIRNKSIKIPLLQRDYVQGGVSDIINNLVTELFSVLKGNNLKGLELNYIYGKEDDKNNLFEIPIDGQQRLITLWLFHLYLYKRNLLNDITNFPLLKFDSREIADNFVECLYNKNISFDDNGVCNIENMPWFISGWKKDITVQNLLKAWNCIVKKGNGLKNNDYSEELKKITFKFRNIEDLKVSDDIYLKMNGRGKPLSYFDNLKSFMDDFVEKINNEDDSIIKDWQQKIDNEWTNLFWKNRNKNDKVQEDISDEQTRLFYSLLTIYWIKNKKNLIDQLEKKVLKDFDDNLDLDLFREDFNIDKDASFDKMADKIVNVLKSLDKPIPLYWIEKLSLFNKDVFIFIYKGMNKLNEVADCLNEINSGDLPVNLFVPKKAKNDKYDYKIFYSIALIQDASYSTSLPYLYALISTPNVCNPYKNEVDLDIIKHNFHRYMRLIRNLIININQIDAINITNIFTGIDSIVATIKDINFYKNFEDFIFDRKEKFKSYDVEQLEEEKNKLIKLIEDNENPNEVSTIESDIFIAEQSNFLTGAISFLYIENKKGNVNWDNFNTKYKSFEKYFDKSGIKEDYKDKIMTVFLKQWEFSFEDYVFSTKAETWKRILTNKKYATIINSILYEDLDKLLLQDIKPVLIKGLNKHQNEVQEKFKNLLMDESYRFVNFINNKSKLDNARFVDSYGGCFYKYRASKNVILFGLEERDSLLTKYFKQGLIEFITESKINNENANHYEIAFFYHKEWDLQFNCKKTNQVYSWDYDNEIYKKLEGNDNWERITLEDLKKEIE